MKVFSLMFGASSFWLCILLFTFNLCSHLVTASISENQTDHLALLKFKKSISSDPYGILDSWNSSSHFCNWHGITCSPMRQRVTEMNLTGYELHGSLSPHVGNLSFLTQLYLSRNNFHGNIPQELGRLLRLQMLRLANNSFAGGIPTNLTSCFDLRGLGLNGNNLIGQIPIEIGYLRKLRIFEVEQNNLRGGVLPFIGNLSSLVIFSVTTNKLEGDIPQEICRLKNLSFLLVGANKFSGTFPSCLYNMSSLTFFSAASNQFGGSLPPNMFHTLPNLLSFLIGMNKISGPIPTSLANASSITEFDIAINNFVGQVPSLGKLHDLQLLNLQQNNLGDNSTNNFVLLMKSLTNCSHLQILSISTNNFGGPLPNYVANLSTQLTELYLGSNHISGKLPVEIGNLINLIGLGMERNNFEGTIPIAFGKFQKMQELYLDGSKLSGDIPASIGNLTQLSTLYLGQNRLEGNIPQSITNYQKLQYFDLSHNNLRGNIPSDIFSFPLLMLDLSNNSFSGSLPVEVGRMKNIGWLDISENQLSGDIPGAIGECMTMEYLSLLGNSFHGIIPNSLASLKGLRKLDLSRNRLSGSIPKDLQNITLLKYFNVSFNMLEGEVPTQGVFQNASAVFLTGNNNLCGGISKLHLLPCPVNGNKHVAKNHNFKLISVIVSVVVFVLILVFILIICWMRKRNKKASSHSAITIDQLAVVSYQNLHNGTEGFIGRYLIGSGNFGSVYKGRLESEERFVAIKVLKLQMKGAHKSFIAECNALKNIRHRNLLKILTCCSSTDYKGQEFKALVFEYMNNGSLESWLHPETTDQPNSLNLEQMFNIIVDVASAFYYLHHEIEQPVIHCDLKPSNILLDDDMVAHVSDFGIARLVSTVDGASHKQSSTTGIKGTIGYAPPEYGMGSELSIEGDIYSFGILILEMLTGKRPTDELFKDGHDLHNYVEVSIISHSSLIQIVDPAIILLNGFNQASDEENIGIMQLQPNVEKCLLSLFRVALACSMESARDRMSMVHVTRELNIIKSFFPR